MALVALWELVHFYQCVFATFLFYWVRLAVKKLKFKTYWNKSSIKSYTY